MRLTLLSPLKVRATENIIRDWFTGIVMEHTLFINWLQALAVSTPGSL